MNINRRVKDFDGNTKFGNNPYGPVDHDVAVMRIDNLQDKPVAIFFNWPCHGSILGGTNFLISGDWPGVTADYAERNIANGIIALPTAGASGNLNSITGSVGDFISYNNYLLGVIVKDLGEKVINTAKNIQTYHSSSIKASQMVIKLPGKENENAGQKSDIEELVARIKTRLNAIGHMLQFDNYLHFDPCKQEVKIRQEGIWNRL